MEWQFPIVLLVVAGAVFYLAHSFWRSWSGVKGRCGGSCACGKGIPGDGPAGGETSLIPAEDVTLRRRQTKSR
jgi:hypothetical protein